jgi:hypothetical protein
LTDTAQNAIDKILAATGISRVVCLDDSYGQPQVASFAVGFGLAGSLDAEGRMRAFQDLPRLDVEVPRVFEDRFREHWNSIDENRRRELIRKLRELSPNPPPLDNPSLDNETAELVRVLFSKYNLRTFASEEEWRANENEILQTAKVDKTLALFDEDLSGRGDGEEGLALVKRIHDRTNADEICCGLLSHKHQPENITREWEEICKEKDLDRGRFVLIPKSFASDPDAFATIIKITAISKPCTDLKVQTKKILDGALEVASRHLDNINIYDLEEIVFRSAYKEGVWEPETLLRLFALYHRIETRKNAMGDAELYRLSNEIRKVSVVVDSDSKSLPSHKIWGIERLEIFEDGKFLNELHRPIDLGDIFVFGSGKKTKTYILIAPPCDLMVRSKRGLRGTDSETIKEAVLAELRQHGRPGASWELDHYKRGQRWFVDFKNTRTVKLWALDLCVFNVDGSAQFEIGRPAPPSLVPAWRERYDFISDIAAKIMQNYREFAPSEAQKPFLERHLTTISNELLVTGSVDVESGRITYPFRRIERLLAPRATALITAYAQFLTRAAYEHPFETSTDTDEGREPDAEIATEADFQSMASRKEGRVRALFNRFRAWVRS